MKRIAALLLVILAPALADSAQALEFKQHYDAPEFSASFEGSEREWEDTILRHHEWKDKVFRMEAPRTVAGSKLTKILYVQIMWGNNVNLAVGYIDFPPNSTFNLDAEVSGRFATFRANVARGYSAKPPDVKELYPRFDTTVSGIPARGGAIQGMRVIDSDQPLTEYFRVFVKGSRLWEARFSCSNGVICSDADARTFFNSIVIK